jgi:diguanylate cyclase (GGDEF)-like protein
MPWLPCSALMVHPLMVEDEIIGVMMVQSRKANAYSEHTLDLLGLLAAYLSIAIQIARKTDQLKEEIRQRKLAEQELRRLNGELASLSRRDGLTNIANRRLFESYLQDSWQQAQRQQGPISLLMIDIDFFKEYNDANGHLSGDEAIKQLARALQNSVKRGTDLVARFGGDEFVVLLTDTDSAGALHVARRIQQAVAVCCIPHTDSSISRLVSVSIGAATMIPGAESAPSELIARSDAALYQAGIGTQPNLRFCFRR